MTYFRGAAVASNQRDHQRAYGSMLRHNALNNEAVRPVPGSMDASSSVTTTKDVFVDEQENSLDGDTNDDDDYDARVTSGSHVLEYSDTSEEHDSDRKLPEIPPKSGFGGQQEGTSTDSLRMVRFHSSFSDDDDEDPSPGAGRSHPHEKSPIPPPPSLGRLNTTTNIINNNNRRHHHHQQQQQQQQQHHQNQHHSNNTSLLQRQERDNGGQGPNRQHYEHKRAGHRKQHIHPSKSPDWVAQFAYSFRSPSPIVAHRRQQLYAGSSSSISLSSTGSEYHPGIRKDPSQSESQPGRKVESRKTPRNSNPPGLKATSLGPSGARNSDTSFHASDASPLLGASRGIPSIPSGSPPADRRTRATQNYVALAASFLRDYENGRAPTLSTDLDDVSDRQLRLYEFKFGGYAFQFCTVMASMAFFASSMLEGFDISHVNIFYLTALNLVGLFVFILDIWFRYQLRGNPDQTQHTRHSRSERLVKPVILFAIILAVENVARVAITPHRNIVLFSSFFKPLILFYASSKARDTLEALGRILRIVVRVLALELLLILMFAAVACRLFHQYSTFADLSTAWLSLYELSTTVVNPSLWMPIYQNSPGAALFFVIFIIISVFYLHTLVLSVVFSTYIQAAAEIHERSSGDREDSIQMAFVALQRQEKQNVVDVALLRETLRIVRPHYNAMKINALVEIVDPTNQRVVDFGTFRTKIRQALNASIRTARSATVLSTLVEIVAVAVAVLNFVYVIIVSSTFHASWSISVQEIAGSVITAVAGFELLIRFNPLRIPDFTPLTRLNATFDGLALLACVTSLVGIILFAAGQAHALEYILIGRAIDMVRIMRFFQIFRDVVRRSSDVLPALAGPGILVVSTVHIFVYIGMALWGGAINVGQHFGEITYLYDLNNFNSYTEGLVTMFQVLVGNDWQAVAEVFLFAERCSSPFVVYPVFILANMVGVSIMLNVMIAFFVETFVTKLDDGASNLAEGTTTYQKERDFNILADEEKKSVRVGANSERSKDGGANQDSIDRGADADSEASSGDLYEFDVYEREGFDKIMETVAGSAQNHDFAQQMSNYLEIFEKLTPGREKVGYLICDQSTLERVGNRRFQSIAMGYLLEQELNEVVSDMHAQLVLLSTKDTLTKDDRAISRTFSHRHDSLKVIEITATILRTHPTVSLFVLRALDSSLDPRRPRSESNT